MTRDAIVRAGHFSFKCRTCSDRFVVTKIAVQVIGDFVGKFCGRGLIRILDRRHG